MDVTKSNFDSAYPLVIEAIEKCDFLTLDCEFSGFGLGSKAISAYDTPLLIYEKVKKNVQNFQPIQIGLAAFRYEPTLQKYFYQAFNFFVFPRIPKAYEGFRYLLADALTFSCQADCLEFLGAQNLDFNKWICNGVGYLRESEIDIIRNEIKVRFDREKSPPERTAPKVPPNLEKPLEKHLKDVKEFLDDTTLNETTIKDLDWTLSRLLRYSIEKHIGHKIYVKQSRQDGGSCVDFILRKCADDDEYEKCRKEVLDQKLRELDDASGFCKVIEAVSKSGKPLVGHNMYMDLLYILQCFCSPLPKGYTEFKALLQNKFSQLYDTRVVSTHDALKNIEGNIHLALQRLHLKVTEKPFRKITIEPDNDACAYKDSEQKAHEAGYDAFMTGSIFIHLTDYIAVQKVPGRFDYAIPWTIVKPYSGRINSSRVTDLPYVSLFSPDLVPDRRHVFHLKMTAGAEWTNVEITRLFSTYGYIYINWIDDTSAFIALQNKEYADRVFKSLKEKDSSEWTIRLATDYLKEQENNVLNSIPREGEACKKRRLS